MKLVRFDAGSGPQSGVVADDASGSPGVVGLAAAGCACTDIMDIINGGAAALEAVARTVAKSKPQYALKDVRLLAPITRPGKYLAIGMNYKKHADEARRLGMAIPQHQVWFNKQTSCISGPFDEIDPGVSEKLDYEAELGLVIGTRAKGVSKEDALKYVFGYFVANDVSGDVMGGANNAVTLVTANGQEAWEDAPKDVVARKLIERIIQEIGGRNDD